MKNASTEFGELLTIGIKAIAARQRKTIAVVQDEMGYALERRGGGSAVEYWRRGNVPDYDDVEKIATLCVANGGLDKSWLSDFLQAAHHPGRSTIIQSLFGDNQATAKKLKHNLPRRDYVELIGRQKQLEEIASWLQPDVRAWLLTIDGIGGIGKSALALESAYRLLENRPPFVGLYPYEAVVWVSAKQEFLTLDGKMPSADFFRTLADVYTAIADVLERENIIRSEPKDQGRLVKRVLSEQAVLLIVDNLESVADKTVHAFLHKDLPPPSKAIITTRERIDVAQKMRLTALSREEGMDLINRKVQEAKIVLTEDQRDKLYRRTGGIPLVITLSMDRITSGYPIDSILADLGKVQKDLVPYCIQSSIDALQSKDARQTLLALSMFATDADHHALQVVAGFADDPLSYEEALAHLEQLSLIDENSQTESKRYTMLPTTRAFVHQNIEAQSDLRKAMIERQIKYYLHKLSQVGYDYTPENWEILRGLDEERGNLLSLMTYLYENKRWQQVIECVAYLYGYLSFYGHWSDYLEWVERAETAAKELQATDQFELVLQKALGWCLSERCWIQINLGRLEQARNTISKALNLFRQASEQNGEATALRHFGLIEKRTGNFEQSRKYYSEALDIWQTLQNEREVASIYNNLGSLGLEEKNYAEAELLLLKSLKIKENLGDIPRLGNTLFYLGEVYFYQDRMQQAKDYFVRTCEITGSCGEILYQARSSLYLARIAARSNDLQVASQLAEDSLNLFQHLGMENECRDVIGLLLEIQRK